MSARSRHEVTPLPFGIGLFLQNSSHTHTPDDSDGDLIVLKSRRIEYETIPPKDIANALITALETGQVDTEQFSSWFIEESKGSDSLITFRIPVGLVKRATKEALAILENNQQIVIEQHSTNPTHPVINNDITLRHATAMQRLFKRPGQDIIVTTNWNNPGDPNNLPAQIQFVNFTRKPHNQNP